MTTKEEFCKTIIKLSPHGRLLSQSLWSTVHLVSCQDQKYIIKHSTHIDAELIIRTEYQGLESLSQYGFAPKLYGYLTMGGIPYIVMEYIDDAPKNQQSQERFGRKLAKMHQTTHPEYGLDYDNCIAGLSQSNVKTLDWSQFYVRHRLLPQYRLAINQGLLPTAPSETKMIHRLNEWLPPEMYPSLLHGDLWSGNYITHSDGDTYLIDPAISYGHSYVDIAMTKLFGGFSPAFYNAYHEIIPAPPYQTKLTEIYQLYYLLIHLNLFGRSYHTAVANITNRYFT